MRQGKPRLSQDFPNLWKLWKTQKLKKSKNTKFKFFEILRILIIEIFEFFRFLNFNHAQLTSQTMKVYDNFDSTAINSVIIEENVVKVVYNSNIDKEYTFNCENVEEFEQNLCKELTEIELTNTKGSVGRFVYQQIKNGVLVENK
jgi:hypothetical protein